MKNTKSTILTFLFIFSVQFLMAGFVPKEKAAKTGIQFLNNIKPELGINTFSEAIIIEEHNEILFYIFNFNSGYIIVSAENSVYPVLGFSLEEKFTGSNLPAALNWWIDGYKQQISYAIETSVKPSKRIQLAWSTLEQGNNQHRSTYEIVEPLLNTTWNQGCYYNSALPTDSSGSCNHPYTGCVATALGQILKYYNYPKSGTGSNGIYTPYGWLEVNFAETNYDWVSMENNLTEDNPAVAGLLLSCVVGVNSQFLPGGTGAYDFDAKDALIEYFDYNESTQFLWRNSYFGDWEQLLRDELDQGRPVIYGGVDQASSAGHTLICDGYFDTDFFHFNWGWGGLYNGYFLIDSLIAGGNFFNFQHDAIIGIKPNIPESLDLYPVENLSAQIEKRDVTLSWEVPAFAATLELLGYHIFRNDTLLNPSIITTLQFIDENAPPGNHEYTVRTSYIGKNMGPSATTEVYVSGITDPFDNLFTVFPNPVHDQLNIQLLKSINLDLRISLLNTLGQTVFSMNMDNANKPTFQIDCKDFQPGVYLLILETDKIESATRILIR